MLSDEERARLGAPISTPMPPPAGPGIVSTPPLTEGQRELVELPPRTPAEPQPPLTLPGAPLDQGPTWQDLIIESRNSELLGGNLAAGGEARPGDGYQAHHIIPSNDARAADLQRLLVNARIDPNWAVNGVWLPQTADLANQGETPHNETFRDSYFEYLRRTLDGATGRAEIESRLAQIKDDLRNGRVDLPRRP